MRWIRALPVVVAVASVPADALAQQCAPGAEIHAYDALQPGTRGWIEARWDGRAWVPARALDMPLHHASRIEWVDAADHPEFAAHDRTLRVAFVVVDRRLERSIHPGVLVDATYRLDVEAICR